MTIFNAVCRCHEKLSEDYLKAPCQECMGYKAWSYWQGSRIAHALILL